MELLSGTPPLGSDLSEKGGCKAALVVPDAPHLPLSAARRTFWSGLWQNTVCLRYRTSVSQRIYRFLTPRRSPYRNRNGADAGAESLWDVALSLPDCSFTFQSASLAIALGSYTLSVAKDCPIAAATGCRLSSFRLATAAANSIFNTRPRRPPTPACVVAAITHLGDTTFDMSRFLSAFVEYRPTSSA